MSLSALIFLVGLFGAVAQSILANVFPRSASFPELPDSPSKAHFEISHPGVCKTSGLGPALQPSNFNTFGRSNLELNDLLNCLEILSPSECTMSSTAPSIGRLNVNIVEGTRPIPKYTTNDYRDELFFHVRYPSICIGRLHVINVTQPAFNYTNIGRQIKIQSISTNLRLTVSLLPSAAGTFNRSTPNGIIPQNSTVTFGGSASDIISGLNNLWFIPFSYNGSVQNIRVILTDDVQTLSTVLSIPSGTALPPVINDDTPNNSSDLIVGSSTGSPSDWYSFIAGGSVSDYSGSNLQNLYDQLTAFTRVAPNFLEIGSIQPGSVVVFFRFLGLTPQQVEQAIKNFVANCNTATNNALTIVCTLTPVGKTILPSGASTTSSNSNLSAGAIVGIVIGSVAAGLIALCLILFVISRSRKSSPAAKNVNKYEDKDFGTGYVAPAPITGPTPNPTPVLIAHN